MTRAAPAYRPSEGGGGGRGVELVIRGDTDGRESGRSSPIEPFRTGGV